MNSKYETMGKDLVWMKKLLFAGIFIQENRLHAVFDKYNDMSVKQWLLLAACEVFNEPPDLSSLASVMGCSRQNVKKIAICLERDGYILLKKSASDARAVCVVRTEKGKHYTLEREEYRKVMHEIIYQDFTEEEIRQYYQLSIKMMKGIDHLEQHFVKMQNES